MRRVDLAKLVTPVAPRPDRRGRVLQESLDRSPLTPEAQRRALEAMDAAERLAQEIRARRGGRLFTPESWELLNESRDERSRDLA